MNTRAIGSVTLTFGLVSIPVKIYVARSSESVSFNLLHAKCGGRLNQELQCRPCKTVVARGAAVKGYPIGKEQWVIFSEEELKALDSDKTKAVEIQEFVPLGTIDPVFFEDAHFLGPDEGSERAFQLLRQAMLDTETAGIAQMVSRGKETLVGIRVYGDGLMLHALVYADEMRTLDVPLGKEIQLSPKEIAMARQLVNQLASEEFTPSKYKDTYRSKIEALVEQKRQGKATLITN